MKAIIFILILIVIHISLIAQDDKSNCNVVFSYSIQENQLSQFYHKVVTGNGDIVSYLWNFGDGYQSNEASPQHVYLNPGIYTTCLTVIFGNNCQSTYCDTIIVRNPVLDTLQNYGISGYVYAGTALLPDGIAVLIRLVNNEYSAVEYCRIDDGLYHFSNLTQGTYCVYAIPYFNLNVLFYPNYFPTYFGNELTWQNALPIVVNGLNINKNISLISSSQLLMGNDSITGNIHISDSAYFEYNVYLNNWFSDSLPSQEDLDLAPNQVVLLFDENNNPQRFALSNHRGRFLFLNIPDKIFKIRPEKHGLTSELVEVNSGSGQNNIDFYIMSSSIVIGIENNSLPLLSGKIFPNPVENLLYISISSSNYINDLTISLTDINGRTIYQQTFKHNPGDSYIIPTQHLAAGTYILQINSSEFQPYRTKVIKK